MEDFGPHEAGRRPPNLGTSSPDVATPHEFEMSKSASILEDLTDLDEPSVSCINEPPQAQTSPLAPPKNSRNALMSLLSGSQISKKKTKEKRREKDLVGTENSTEMTIIEPTTIVEPEIEPQIRPNTSDLERIMFSNAPSVSASDFMTGFKRQNVIEVMSDPVEEESFEHVPVTEIPDQAFEELKLYQGRNIKRASARDVLAAFKPLEKAKSRRSTPQSMKVVLKITPYRLKEIQKTTDNPFFTRGALLTMKTDKSNPTSSAFASLMASAKSSTPKLTPLQKLKELEPPHVLHRMFQVQPAGSTKISTRNKEEKLELPFSKKTSSAKQEIDKDEFYDFPTIIGQEKPPKYQIIPAIHKIRPEPPNTSISRRIYDQFVAPSVVSTNEGVPWTQLFKPRRTEDLMLPAETSSRIKSWMTSSFDRLKSQSYAAPRNQLLKQQKKRNLQTSCDSFIVPDDWEDEPEVPTIEVFVPVLILQGHHGCGKSAAVYAAVEAMHGYVHEINSGQARSRRDLYGTLKEFCTTQLVHSSGLSDFQKGIVLFEDADVLFEQDRTFWTVVQEMINISRKPIVITCSDISTVPKSILQHAMSENAVIFMDKAIYPQLSQEIPCYLWWCGFSQQYSISANVIDEIMARCSYNGSFDMRRALNCLQIVCQSPIQGPKQVNMVQIHDVNEASKLLSQLARELEICSEADIIESNTFSLIETYRQPNEIIDVYIIDNSEQLHQKTLPYELNVGQYIHQALNDRTISNDETSRAGIKFNLLRDDITTFVGSRTRKLTKVAMEASFSYSGRTTRSSALSLAEDLSGGYLRTPTPVDWWRPERTGIPEASVCKYLAPTAFVLELAPQVRDWARFQQSLDRVELDSIQKNNVSVKKFLEYRDFQEDASLALATFEVV